MQIDEAIEKAVQHQQQGRWAEAETIYRQVLHDSPDHVIAIQLLGTLALEQNRLAEAIFLIGKAVEFAPNIAAFHNNLGNALRANGQVEAAVNSYRRAIEIEPSAAKSWINLGNAFIDLKQFNQSMAAYSRAIQLDPNDAIAHSNLAAALNETGKRSEAIACYQKAISLDPGRAENHNNLANVLCDADRLDEAIEAARQAIALEPDYAEAHSNLGTILKQSGRFTEAIACHQRAIELQPNLAEAHCNLGVALADSGRLSEAKDSLARAIGLVPDYAEGWVNLAVVLCNLGETAASREACRRAIGLTRDQDAARCNIAQVLLTLGDFENGWSEYESRWKANPRIRPTPFTKPRWNGESLQGKTILLHAEQGLGDAIHFVRYVPLVRATASRVILECQKELVQLFDGVEGVDQIVPSGSAIPEFDVHCPLMSLPLIFGTTLDSVPANVPYIRNRNKRELEGRGPGLNVGLVWAGRSSHSNDRNRSMRLYDFAPLAAVPGVTIHSLQKGTAAAQALSPPNGMVLVDHSAVMRDFTNTAELTAELDLVIAVDTAVAHLAGALGKPVWLLLPLVPDWRWMRDRSDSPWYPTMRLFRQTQWGSWHEPISRIVDALAEK